MKLSAAALWVWVLLRSHPGGRSHCCAVAEARALALPGAEQEELEVEVEGRAEVAWGGTRGERQGEIVP